jgi:hypothetical protein
MLIKVLNKTTEWKCSIYEITDDDDDDDEGNHMDLKL